MKLRALLCCTLIFSLLVGCSEFEGTIYSKKTEMLESKILCYTDNRKCIYIDAIIDETNDHYPVFPVSAYELDEIEFSKFKKLFLGNAFMIYPPDKTKTEIQNEINTINTLKKAGSISEMDSKTYIAYLQLLYSDAPEQSEIIPFNYYEKPNGTGQQENHYFEAYSIVDDEYSSISGSINGNTLIYKANANYLFQDEEMVKYDYSRMGEIPSVIIAPPKINREEAIAHSKSMIDELHIKDFGLDSVRKARIVENNQLGSIRDSGWLLTYTRVIDGRKMKYLFGDSVAAENQAVNTSPFGQERIQFVVTEEGIQYCGLINILDVGKATFFANTINIDNIILSIKEHFSYQYLDNMENICIKEFTLGASLRTDQSLQQSEIVPAWHISYEYILDGNKELYTDTIVFDALNGMRIELRTLF